MDHGQLLLSWYLKRLRLYLQVDGDERAKYASELDIVPGASPEDQYLKVGGYPPFYPNLMLIDLPQVRWTRVPDLVEKRRVFLRDGWAYVPNREQSSIVLQEFQTRLERALEVVCRPFAKGLILKS